MAFAGQLQGLVGQFVEVLVFLDSSANRGCVPGARVAARCSHRPSSLS
jgi:hypothetical protein